MADDPFAAALHDIEHRLSEQDPDFAARMRAPDTGARPIPKTLVLCALLYIILPIEALLLGWTAALITLAAATAIMVLLRHLH
ncbi:DUF3040 domain-containing protein [Actinoplanes sp. TFC3]|uniref:DUF3040 domain-containing protein n=1 Tax=Actinoplanes sp. TFC3 TaxID=1710355 RepID=UPI00083163F7|nr:DUF3040 domain-containing protein [Actinoplanes sp. TFC3]